MPNNIAGSMLMSVLNPDGTLVGSGGGGAVTISGQPIQVVQSAVGTSLHHNTTFIAAAGGTVVATATAPATGTYRVVVNQMLTGTGTAVNNNNYRLVVGGVQIVSPISLPNEKSVISTNEIIVTATSAQTIQVQSINNEPTDVAVNTSLNVYRVV